MSTIPMGKITIYATGFKVSDLRPLLRGPVKWFSDKFIERYSKQVAYGKAAPVTKEIVGDPFFCAYSNGDEYRFHINELEAFYDYLSNKGYPRSVFAVETLFRDYPIAEAKLKWISPKEDRAEQIEPIEFLMQDAPMRVAELQTGSGKTYMSLKVLCKSQMRAMIVMKPEYIERWACPDGIPSEVGIDLENEDDILIVRSTQQFIDLIDTALSKELSTKLIIIHNTTLRTYLNTWFSSNGGDDIYGCPPEHLMEVLGVGIRVMEEAHQDINLNYRLDCCLNTWKTIYLTATISTNASWFKKKIFERMFDKSDRITMEYKIYTKVRAYSYYIEEPKKIKCMGFMGFYNHALFETSIQRLRKFDRYMEIIFYMLEDNFIHSRRDGQKAIVYMFKTEICIDVAKRLQIKYPHLRVGYKIGGIADADGYSHDIIVTTLKSTGTGKDIPGVTFIALTISINSEQANEQVKGRARKPNDDTIPTFAYCYANNIPKHVSYHEEKKRIFQNKVLGHAEIFTGICI